MTLEEVLALAREKKTRELSVTCNKPEEWPDRLGTVNRNTFMGHAPGTLLVIGLKPADLDPADEPLTVVTFVADEIGHNRILRPNEDRTKFEVYRAAPPLYEEVEF
jgi:hypothetical protein